MRNILLTAVLVLFGVVAFAQERIAVFPFEDMDNVFTRNESVMFYREFSNEFTNRSAGRFSVIPRQEVERLINTEAAFQLSDFSARVKTAEMQRVLNGSQILSGLIGRVGNNIRITVSLYTYPELQQLPGGATLSVSNKNELFNIIPELVRSMQNEIVGGGTEQPIPVGLEYEITEGGVTITKYTGNDPIVNIPNQIQGFPVTGIGDLAFTGHMSLISIIIPSSVTVIGLAAFADCYNLFNITIPSSVTSIGDYAFSDCYKLTSITIPYSVMSIGRDAFPRCFSLTNITVDSRNLAYTSIDGVLFDKTIRTIIRYPIGKNTMTYVIPSSVTAISNGAFADCRNLTSVTIPSSVMDIGEMVFMQSGLSSITIPSSITLIGELAFVGCSNLTDITVDNRNPAYASIDGVLFNKSLQTIIAYPERKNASTYTIPSSVMVIGREAFYNCRILTSITIPSSVTSIGDEAFRGCDSLTSITLSRRTQVGTDAFPPSARITYRD
jgi:TolB-like protein